MPLKGALFIEYISDTAGHASGKITSAVANAETLPRHPTNIRFPAGGSIDCYITNDNVFFWGERRTFGRKQNHFPAGKSLAKIIVGIALQFEGHTGGHKRAKTLPRRPAKMKMDRVLGQSLRPKSPSDFAAKNGSHDPIRVSNR